MSILSRLTSLALKTAQTSSGEDVTYKWDVPIGTEAVYVADGTFTVTLVTADSSGLGKIQRSTTSSGPWTDVITLDDGDFPVVSITAGSGYYRVTDVSSDTELVWNYSVTVTDAIRARQSWQIDEPGGNRFRTNERLQHWIIEAEQIVDADGDAHEPTRGDRITAGSETYYVIPETPNGSLWRYANRQGKTHFRIFTRERS